MTDHKTPPSQMIRVPTALIGAVRQLSKLNREGHTIALLQGLKELISQFDSDIDINVAPSSKSVSQLEQRLEKLESHLADKSSGVETKLEAIAQHLEKMERAMASGRYSNSTRARRQVYSHQQPQVELQPRTNTSLAQRLGVTSQSLITEREKLSAKEFISYTRHRDPMNTGWEFSQKDGLYHPIK
ncbi:hypothetical protein IQ243_24000 [Nostocales cyanobacterium LEGE 11386]|nr:hypothetical protein [Nostocales cyanobacterium LEGE 11386]